MNSPFAVRAVSGSLGFPLGTVGKLVTFRLDSHDKPLSQFRFARIFLSSIFLSILLPMTKPQTSSCPLVQDGRRSHD